MSSVFLARITGTGVLGEWEALGWGRMPACLCFALGERWLVLVVLIDFESEM